MKTAQLSFCISIISIAFFVRCSKSNNSVEKYLNNAEIQCETDEQRQNVAIALNDALTLSEKELEVKKYKDYQGVEAQWNLRTVIEKYFVSEKPVSLGDNFYRNIKSEGSQTKIKKFLEELNTSK